MELGLSTRATPPVAPQQGPTVPLLHTTWDQARVSSSVAQQGWSITPADADAVVVDEAGRRGIRLASASGAAARVCQGFRAVDSGRLVVTANVFVEGAPLGDSPILAVRAGGSELSGARFLKNGHFGYRVGPNREQTVASWVPGRWYEMELTVDFDTSTYGWTVRQGAAPGAAPLLDINGVALLAGGPADEVCVTAPREDAGSGLLLDELEVLWVRP